ncbi:MAG TPA: 3D domain-containing protein [Atopostipes sp.]|nr:3D domain-containing protein [Atopostipes sp.]
MNKWIKKVVAFALIVSQFLVIPAVSAGSLENIQKERELVEEEVTQLQSNINDKLAEASEISIALEELRQEIDSHEASIAQTKEDIEKQEVIVQERYEYTADQLKAMQKSEVNHNLVLSLLQAESITDFFNTVYAAAVLTGANEEHLNEAQEEQEKLNILKEELLVYSDELENKKEETVQKQEALEETLAELETTLANNQKQIEELDAKEAEIHAEEERKRLAEEERQRAAAEQKEAERAQSQESVEVASAKASSNNSSNSSNSNQSNANAKAKSAPSNNQSNNNSSQAGNWINVQATGYSTQQPGLSTHTATGINLLVNPQVIAVDPSVIPLNSIVEVQGMGVYVAGDTGGAIKGHIIDIHFPTVGQALNWGRRNVKVRIIN